MKKSYIIIGIIVALVIVAIVCFAIYNNRIKDNTNTVEPTSQEENNTEQNIVSNEENEESEVNDMYSSGTHHAQIVVKDYGTILTNESHQEQNEKIILSVEGEAETKNLSKNKELEDVSKVWSSSYVRAISTAKYIAERNSLKINIDSSLNERRLRKLSGIECTRRKVRPSLYNRTNA